MRKIILTTLLTSLVAASTIQMAAAAEHRAHKAYRDNFRGAYDQVDTPSHAIPGMGYGLNRAGNWRDDAKFEPAGS